MKVDLILQNDPRLTSDLLRRYQAHERGFFYEVKRLEPFHFSQHEGFRPYVARALCAGYQTTHPSRHPVGEGYTPEQALNELLKVLETFVLKPRNDR